MLIQQFLFGEIVSADLAFERAFVGVFGAIVISHIGRRSKRTNAFAAFVWPNVVVRFHVSGQFRSGNEIFVTHTARKWSFFGVRTHMYIDVRRMIKSLMADTAFVGLFTAMDTLVLQQIVTILEYFFANGTLEITRTCIFVRPLEMVLELGTP